MGLSAVQSAVYDVVKVAGPMGDEFERIWKEAAVAQLRWIFVICREEMKTTWVSIIRDRVQIPKRHIPKTDLDVTL
jgi:hypothetical protein